MRSGIVLAGMMVALAGCSGEDGGNLAVVANDATALGNDVAEASSALLAPPADPACAAQVGVAATVCADPMLARMDKEVARLFGLVRAAQEPAPDMVPALDQAQRTWTIERDRCGTGAAAKPCLVASYAARIDELRSNYPAARAVPASPDERPSSVGPLAVRCKGLDEPIHALFINVDPDLVRLRWDQEVLILKQAPAASGVRYEGEGPASAYVFWTKGESATFSRPDKRDLECVLEPEREGSAS